MWSDTGSENYGSRGDIKRTINLDAFNIEGPNMSVSKFILKKKVGKDDSSLHSSTLTSKKE
jgi:hypothetical protein